MSRAFVKEQDFGTSEGLPERHVSKHSNDVTLEGMAQMDAALATAQAQYARAVTTDDRAAMAAASRDLRYWKAQRATAHVIPNSSDTTRVHFGSVVTVLRDDDREQTFRIVGQDEADPERGSISYVSPLARAVLGKGIGDRVKVGNGGALIRRIR